MTDAPSLGYEVDCQLVAQAIIDRLLAARESGMFEPGELDRPAGNVEQDQPEPVADRP